MSFDHYAIPCVTYNFSRSIPLLMEEEDECIFISKVFTQFVIQCLRRCIIYSSYKSEILTNFGFSVYRDSKDPLEIDLSIDAITIASVPFADKRYVYYIKRNTVPNHTESNTILNFIKIVTDKLTKASISKNGMIFPPVSKYGHEDDCKKIDIEKYFAVANKFKVILDEIRQDVYIFYEDDPCLVINNSFYRIFPHDEFFNSCLKKYSTFELKRGFASLIVKILNNR